MSCGRQMEREAIHESQNYSSSSSEDIDLVLNLSRLDRHDRHERITAGLSGMRRLIACVTT